MGPAVSVPPHSKARPATDINSFIQGTGDARAAEHAGDGIKLQSSRKLFVMLKVILLCLDL